LNSAVFAIGKVAPPEPAYFVAPLPELFESEVETGLKRLMCPLPDGLVNSPVLMPARVNRHSRASIWPVVMAILGMLVYWPLLSPS